MRIDQEPVFASRVCHIIKLSSKKKEWIELSYDGKLKVEGKTRQVNSVISGYERDAGTCYDL